MNKDLYYGLTSGILSTIICNPLDVIRTHKQLNIKYKNSIRYLYRGLIPSIISIPIFWGIYFPFYNKLKNNNIFGSGYIASCFASTITCPIFFIRHKYQISNSFNTLLYYNKNGIYPFYNSLIPTYLINISMLFQMPIYEYLKNKFGNNTKNIVGITIFSKTISTIITYPMDTVRTIKRNEINLSLLKIIKQLNKNKSMYYSGILIYLARGLPSNIITFCTYEYLKNN